MQVENVKETKREVKKKTIGSNEVYELTVVQEYFSENVKNMLNTWEGQIEVFKNWLKDFTNKEEEVVSQTTIQLDLQRTQIETDLKKTDEEVLKEWKQELEKKRKWLDSYEDKKEQAINLAKQELQKIKQSCETDLQNTEKAMEIWTDV